MEATYVAVSFSFSKYSQPIQWLRQHDHCYEVQFTRKAALRKTSFVGASVIFLSFLWSLATFCQGLLVVLRWRRTLAKQRVVLLKSSRQINSFIVVNLPCDAFNQIATCNRTDYSKNMLVNVDLIFLSLFFYSRLW